MTAWKSLTMACVEEGESLGLSASQIAKTYAIPPGTANYYLWVLRHPDRYRHAVAARRKQRQPRASQTVESVKIDWNTDEVAKLVQWHAFGVPYAEMARRLGPPRTRNSVAGKVYRLRSEGVIRGQG